MVITEVEQAAFDILLQDKYILEIDNEPRFPENDAFPSLKYALCSARVYGVRVGEWCWIEFSYDKGHTYNTDPDTLAIVLRALISFYLSKVEDDRILQKAVESYECRIPRRHGVRSW